MRKSKTPNANPESILVSTPIRRPRHYSRAAVAAELGISHDVLYKRGLELPIYQPAAVLSRTVVIFTDIQIQIISLVMRGKMEPERAYARQRLVSFHRLEERQRAETVRGIVWAVFFLIVPVALLLLGASR